MLKTKLVFSAFVLFVAMTLATGAFAQGTFTVSSTPTSRARDDGHTEVVGNTTFTLTEPIGASGTEEGSLTIDYSGLPITNDENSGTAAQNVQVIGSGCFIGDETDDNLYPPTSDALDDADVTITHLDGVIVIDLPALAAGTCAAGTNSITVSNVHASVVGAGPAPLRATVSVDPGSGFQVVSGQDSPTIISSLRDVLAQDALASTGTAQIRANSDVTDASFSFTVTENYFDALMDSSEIGGGALNDTRVVLEFSGIPDGVTLDFTSAGNGADIGTVDDDVTSGDSTTFISFAAGELDLAAVDTITVDGTLVFTGDSDDLPIDTTTPITMRATLGPVGSLGITDGTPVVPEAGNFPRYQEELTDAITIAGAVAAETNLLIPYATVFPDLNYDTGIAIANTTADGDLLAVEQDGTILFQIWSQDGTMTEWETTEVISPGESWIRLLSDVLANAGTPLPFQGYLIITTAFTNAHGSAFISDFTGFTSATPVLVLDDRDVPESLGQ